MNVTSESQTATVGKISAPTPVWPRTSSDAAPLSAGIVVRVYERFLEMPVALVLGVSWLAGVALVGSCALVVYLAVRALI